MVGGMAMAWGGVYASAGGWRVSASCPRRRATACGGGWASSWVGGGVWGRRRSSGGLRGVPAGAAQGGVQAGDDAGGTVGDYMTRNPLSVKPGTGVVEAMELICGRRVAGLPVVDDDGKCVGTVSDYDLLALDATPGRVDRREQEGFFPTADTSWENFKDLRKRVEKAGGKTVADVMTGADDLVSCHPWSPISEAANLMVRRKLRRLPVLGADKELLGILTRGDVMQAALDAEDVNYTAKGK